MNLLKSFTLISVCITMCLGCAQFNSMPDVGHNYNAEDVSKLQVGISTEQDAIQLFGKPNNRLRNSDGSSQLMYMFSKAHPSAINLMYNRGGYETKTMILNFDSNGNLRDYSQSSQ